MSSGYCWQWDHVSTGLQLVQIVRPCLHHGGALGLVHPSFKSPKDRAPVEHTPETLESKRMKAFYAAQSAKLAYERAAGRLVDVEEVRLFAADLGATFGNGLGSLADRVCGQLPPQIAEQVRPLLEDESKNIRHEIADKLDKGIAHAN